MLAQSNGELDTQLIKQSNPIKIAKHILSTIYFQVGNGCDDPNIYETARFLQAIGMLQRGCNILEHQAQKNKLSCKEGS